MVSPGDPYMNGGEDEEAEAIRVAIALSLGEDPDAPPLGTSSLSSEQARFREARERAEERQRIRIRDQAKDYALDLASYAHHSNSIASPSSFQHVSASARATNKKDGKQKEKVTIDLTLDDDDDDDDDDSNHDMPGETQYNDPDNDPFTTTISKNNNHSSFEDQDQGQQTRAFEADPNPNKTQKSATASDIPAPGGGGIGGLLGGMDRKKMEEERLARLRKRKASELTRDGREEQEKSSATGGTTAATRPAQPLESRPYQRRKLEWPSSVPSALSSAPAPSSMTYSQNTAGYRKASVPFPRGVIKKTWARGVPRQGDDIKIEEVLQKDKLQLAVLSSFQWDDEWLVSKLDLSLTKVILVAYAVDDAQKDKMNSNVLRARIRFCFPPMQGIGHMHSKLQLLKYDDYLRIVVPTGNLVPYDWGETGVMENMVFIIDLPKLDPTLEKETPLTTFGKDLAYFLTAQGLDDRLVDSLSKYDFSETERYAFVHSICGSSSSDDSWRRTGYCGLGRAIDGLGLASKTTIEVDYVCASLGAINDGLLNGIYYACQGDDGLKEYQERTAKGRPKASSTVRNHTRVFFPSEETVLRSRGGVNGAGTICFQPRWHQASTFPREVLRDCKSTRQGMLMHSKVIFVRRQNSNPGGSEGKIPGGFIYIGSANLSESAWGRLVKDRASGNLKITCRNWECGVVLPADSRPDEHEEADTWGIFKSTLPIPMEHPAATLLEKGSQRPWFFQERH